MIYKIEIANDFSDIPGARYPEEGDYSGQEFRKQILAPKLKLAISENATLIVDLDGTAGYGTSFLEEAFGGLIRVDKIPYNDITRTLDYISDEDPSYIDEIKKYLKDAHEKECI